MHIEHEPIMVCAMHSAMAREAPPYTRHIAVKTLHRFIQFMPCASWLHKHWHATTISDTLVGTGV